jgi:predicted Zn-dependent protease
MWSFGSDDDDSPALEVTTQVIGRPPDEALLQVEGAIETHFDVIHRADSRLDVDDVLSEDENGRPVTLRDRTYDPARELYDGADLMKLGLLSDGDKSITVADVPIYFESDENLFGLAYLEGDIAIVSTAAFYDDGEEWTDNSSEWLRKEVIKLFGQMLGVEDCDTEGCVMRRTDHLYELAMLDEFICEDCQDTIGDAYLR